MEVLDRIHQLSLGEDRTPGRGPSVSAYYVLGTDYLVLIDAGFPGEGRTRQLLDYWHHNLGSPNSGRTNIWRNE